MIVEPLQMIAAAAFPGGESALGISPERIAAAEARLQLALPEAVKDFYTVAGARDLKRIHYSMMPPEALRMDGDYLVMCEESEGLESFGLSLKSLAALAERPNPAVHIRQQGQTRWFCEAGNVAAFLLGMESWQVVLSLPAKARCSMEKKELKGLLEYFEPVGDPKVRLGSQYFGMVDRQNGIVAAYMHTSDSLYVGSARPSALDELKQKSQLDFEPL